MAETPARCQDVIVACDKALAARKEEVRLCNLALRQSMDRSSRLEIEVEQKNKQLASPIRNPWIMSAVGLVLGIVVVGAIRK